MNKKLEIERKLANKEKIIQNIGDGKNSIKANNAQILVLRNNIQNLQDKIDLGKNEL